ncbi:protein D2-like [Haliotis cracherodii]|uniref:protein D2-like n=1 Tax=Haliotis cracherodii TaxID=6455 RepID=UPI0039EC730F
MHHSTAWCMFVLLTLVASVIHVTLPCRVDGDICQRNSLLTISFPSSSTVRCNELLVRHQTEAMPTVEFAEAESGQKYLFVMLDPDVPTSGCSYLHAIAIVDFQNGQLAFQKRLVDYIKPSPPSGTHRYQMYLYTWPSVDDSVVYERRPFDVSKLEEDNNLSEPVALFQFRVSSN